MEFLPTDLIRKKRFGGAHTREEIHYLIQRYANNQLPDYQMSAWLMAICCKGMTGEETVWLTEEMCQSGKMLDLRGLGIPVDKHSTGGLGDKTSLILAPLVAAAGIPVPMMAGRGLGHTGGTLDKLESISGFSVNLSFEQFEKQVTEIGAAIMGQTKEICPADRKLYALRDVTGTIDSTPLICGSIMSKKLAEGMRALVLDVKYGSGAFMKTLKDAENLGRALMDIGKRAGCKITVLITRMDEPLGRFIGNALEVQECLDIMDGKTSNGEGKDYSDTIELTLELAGHMIYLGGKSSSATDGQNVALKLLEGGQAKAKFIELCKSQGGDLSKPLTKASDDFVVKAPKNGFMQYTDAEKIGAAAIVLGAGREVQSDVIEFGAGIEVFRRQGDAVQAGDPLFRLFANGPSRIQSCLPFLEKGFKISEQPTPQSPLIAKVLV